MKRNKWMRVGAAIIAVFLFALSASAEIRVSDTDYANPDHWLQYAETTGLPVDIFAVYPTVTLSEDEADIPFVRLDSPLMRGAAEGWLAENSPLIELGNVYAPLYRQLNGAMLADLDSAGFEAHTTSTPREDVFAAFDYFLTHINKGERPFLLLGHSQGAQLVGDVATLLLADEKYAGYNELHIATYAIGYSVTDADIARNPALHFATGPVDAGAILSWNTTAPSEISTGAYKGFGTWKDGARVINPISWTTDELLAHAGDNLPSHTIDADGSVQVVEHYANAVVDAEHSVLVVTTVDESLYPAMMPTISKFHRYDCMFFFDSVKQNIEDRVEAFLSSK